MSFAEFAGRSAAVVPEHNRLRGITRTTTRPPGLADPHPDKADTGHTHADEQRGIAEFSYAAAAAASGSVDFPVAFPAAPVVTLTLLIGSNHDWNINLQGVTTTGFTWRAFQNAGTPLTGDAEIHWSAKAAT